MKKTIVNWFKSQAKDRISRRKMLALVKILAGPLAAWLLSQGIEVEEQAMQEALSALLLLVGGWIGWDGARDWRNRNAEDKRDLNGYGPYNQADEDGT